MPAGPVDSYLKFLGKTHGQNKAKLPRTVLF